MRATNDGVKNIRQSLLSNMENFDNDISRTSISNAFYVLGLSIDDVAGKLQISREYLRLWLAYKKSENVLLKYALHAVMLKHCEELLKE